MILMCVFLVCLLCMSLTSLAQPSRSFCMTPSPERRVDAPCGCVRPMVEEFDPYDVGFRPLPRYECVPGTYAKGSSDNVYCRLTDTSSCGSVASCERFIGDWDKAAPVAKCSTPRTVVRYDTFVWDSSEHYEIDYDAWIERGRTGLLVKKWYPFNAYYLSNGSTDDCGWSALTYRTAVPFPSKCHPLGSQSVTLIVADGAGRESSCVVSVNVVEAVPSRLAFPQLAAAEVGVRLTPALLGASTAHRCLVVTDFTVEFSPRRLSCEDIGRARAVYASVTSPTGAETSEIVHVVASDPSGSCGRPAAACQTQLTPCRAGTYGTVTPDGTWFCFEVLPLIPAPPLSASTVAKRTIQPRSCRLVETNSPVFPYAASEREGGPPPGSVGDTNSLHCGPIQRCAVQQHIESLLSERASACTVVVDDKGQVEHLNMTFAVDSSESWVIDVRACSHVHVNNTWSASRHQLTPWRHPSLLSLITSPQQATSCEPQTANAVTDVQLAPQAPVDPVTSSSLISLNTMLAIALVMLLCLGIGIFLVILRAGRRLGDTSRRLDELAATTPRNTNRRRRYSRRLGAIE